MGKTILQHFDSLPEPIRTMAIRQYKGSNHTESSLINAIFYGCISDNNREDRRVWYSVIERIKSNTLHLHPLVIEWNEKNGKVGQAILKSRMELRKKIVEIISDFGDGELEFETRDITELINWIDELTKPE
jgi:hypothetical protein